MSMAIMITASKMMKNMSPMNLSIAILMISLAMAMLMFKVTMTSWLSYVMVITFSSGMMTLFTYTASLTSNEKSSKKKTNKNVVIVLMLAMLAPTNQTKMTKQTMVNFSSSKMMMVMATSLIITLMAISNHGHHPNQTMNTSF